METGSRSTPFVILAVIALLPLLWSGSIFAQDSPRNNRASSGALAEGEVGAKRQGYFVASPQDQTPSAIHTVEIQPDDFQRTLPRPGLLQTLDRSRIPVALKEQEKKPILDDDPPGGSVSMGGLALWTALIIMLIVGGFWMIKKLFPNSRFLAQGGMINILARKQLSAKHTLLVVEVGRKVFLLADTKDNVVFIKEFADADTVSAIKASSPLRREESIEKSFQEALGESLVEDENVVAVPSDTGSEEPLDTEGVDPEEKEKLDRLFNEVDHIRKTVKDWRNHFA